MKLLNGHPGLHGVKDSCGQIQSGPVDRVLARTDHIVCYESIGLLSADLSGSDSALGQYVPEPLPESYLRTSMSMNSMLPILESGIPVRSSVRISDLWHRLSHMIMVSTARVSIP